jgi:hypothetical protein
LVGGIGADVETAVDVDSLLGLARNPVATSVFGGALKRGELQAEVLETLPPELIEGKALLRGVDRRVGELVSWLGLVACTVLARNALRLSCLNHLSPRLLRVL